MCVFFFVRAQGDEDDDDDVTKKAAAEAKRAVDEANAAASEKVHKAAKAAKAAADAAAEEQAKQAKPKAGGAEEALASWGEKTPKSKRGSKSGDGSAPATPAAAPVITSGKSQLVDSADGTKWVLDLPAGGSKDDMKLTWLGDSLVFRYKKADTAHEHTVALPHSFSDQAVHAKLVGGGETLHIELDKNDGAATGVADGDVVTFETVPNAASSAESIDVELTQTRTEVTVGLRASRSTETVVVVFSNGALEVRATRIEQRIEADKSTSKVKKTVLETIKVPFKPQSISVAALPNNASGRVITLTKPTKAAALVNPKELQIN